MFYSEAILSRRGPLAKVWLAAHMERKLSKVQTLQTDIEESVGAIMGQEVEIMALRLSGQLLLGVVRIYSRKAKYLLDDCNEALLKIKMAFRPGIVDMAEDQVAVNRNAITLQEKNIDLDLLLPNINFDFDFEVNQPSGQHVARVADITLASTNDLQFDFDDPGLDFDLGPVDGIGSQDLEMDLGIDFGDGPSAQDPNQTRTEDETLSVEVGRRDDTAMRSPRASLDSHLLVNGLPDLDAITARSRGVSERPFGDDMDMDFGGDLGMDLDLGLDFGDGTAGDITIGETGMGAGKERSPSRASSRLTTPPPSPPPEDPNVTPRAGEQSESPLKKRKLLNKKQIIDSVTELEDGPGMNIGRGRNANYGSQVDVSDIVTKQHFLPRSRSVMRLLEIRRDPLSHFLPTKTTATGMYFCAGPPGLAPELIDMFMKPIINVLTSKRRETSPDKPNKKARLDKDVAGDDELEQGRRAGSLAPSIGIGSDVLRHGSIAPDFEQGLDFGDNLGAGMDDFQFEGDMNLGEADFDRERSKSRLSTPAHEGGVFDETQENFADSSCPIAMFDEKPSQSQSQKEAADQEGKGYSRNTVKALALIRKDLQPSTPGREKIVSFQQMSNKASRRAASSFFFELLVLGTRDCIKLSQSAPYENIEVRAKDKLWERQRHASIAPSVAASET